MHQIRVDRIHRLVEARIDGFTNRESADRAGLELRAAIRSLGAPYNAHLTLYDVSGMGVAASGAVAYVEEIWTDPREADTYARKIAFCTPSAIARMQLSRLQDVRPGVGVFATRDEALDYLLN